MIGKLLKYEIKAIARYLIPLYLVFIAITIFNRFFISFEVLENPDTFILQTILSIIMIVLYFLMIFAVLIGTAIVLILRYYKNFFGDEGYLSFTLPVKTYHHIFTKFISSIFWVVIDVVIILISLFIFAKGDLDYYYFGFSRFLEELGMMFGSSIYVLIPIYLLSTLILITLHIYNSITIGHRFQNNKIILSFVTYFVFYLITQLVFLFTAIMYFNVPYRNLEAILVQEAATPNWVGIPEGGMPNLGGFLATLTIIILLMAIGHYISINYSLKNKLNLE